MRAGVHAGLTLIELSVVLAICVVKTESCNSGEAVAGQSPFKFALSGIEVGSLGTPFACVPKPN
jgi:prepilin-type N-terminal cleavage/methylation domain-containing protein